MNEEKIKYLYKYRPLYSYWKEITDPKTGKIISKIKVDEPILNKNTLNILTKGQLHFSSPLDFNDPFDSLINIEKKYKKLLLLEDTIETRLCKKKNDVTFQDLVGKKWSDLPNESWKNMINSLSVSQLRILCTSATYNSILMWSHYADAHKGICIGFNFNNTIKGYSLELEDTSYNFEEVKYIDDFDIQKINNLELKNSLYYKKKEWVYEQECRLVLDKEILKNDDKNIDIDLGFVKEIIFGVLTPIKFIYLLISQMHESAHKMRIENYELKFYQMKRNIGSYKLYREELDYRKYIKIEE